MCKQECGCRKKENLKNTPAECTPEQIRECHGEEAGHPCEEPEK
ncbi:MAG: hypothetical protein ACLFQK_01045 [Fibrobacterota bacterium]